MNHRETIQRLRAALVHADARISRSIRQGLATEAGMSADEISRLVECDPAIIKIRNALEDTAVS